MRSSSIGFSDFLPLRTSDRHFEFASRRCLRGDRPRSATRIDRRILLKNDLLGFGRASWIDSQSCSATWVLSDSTDLKLRSCAGSFGFCLLLRLCELPAATWQSARVPGERLILQTYDLQLRTLVACCPIQHTELARGRCAVPRGHLVESSCVMPPTRRLASETAGRLAIAQAGMHREKSGADPAVTARVGQTSCPDRVSGQ